MAGTLIASFETYIHENFAAALDSAATIPTPWSLAAERRIRNSGSTPAVTAFWSDEIALGAGTHTIDLTSLQRGSLGAVLNLTGLKIYYFELWNTGAAAMTFVTGVANGYNVFGTALGKVTLGAGARYMFDDPIGWGAVAGADLGIDVTGTGAQIFRVAIGAGA